MSHDHLPRDDYVSLSAWKRALHYMVQSETQMCGIQITMINNHEAKINAQYDTQNLSLA